MTLEDILNRLLEIQRVDPELLQQDAKYLSACTASEFWDADDSDDLITIHTGSKQHAGIQLQDIDEITKVYDSDADAEVYIFHP